MTGPSIAICRRSLRVAFRSRGPWLVTALLAAASGALTFGAISGHDSAVAAPVVFSTGLFEALVRLVPFASAFAAAGSFARARRDGRLESLLSAPVSESEIVHGAFAASFVRASLQLLLAGACTVVSCRICGVSGMPGAALFATGIVGLLAFTAMCTAFGVFCSLATGSESAAAAVVAMAGSSLASLSLGDLPGFPPRPLDEIFSPVAFAAGSIDSRPLVVCLGAAALAVFLSVRFLESRRWLAASAR